MNTNEIIKLIRESMRDGDVEESISLIQSSPEWLHIETAFGSWLHVAADFGNLNMVKRLVEIGAEINRRGGILEGNALDVAAHKGELEIVEYLIKKGAEMDVSDTVGNPLFSAIQGGHEGVVKLLLARGINADATFFSPRRNGNMNAVSFARELGQTKMAELLLAHGCSMPE